MGEVPLYILTDPQQPQIFRQSQKGTVPEIFPGVLGDVSVGLCRLAFLVYPSQLAECGV